MPSTRTLLTRRSTAALLGFQLLFFAGMWLSKTAQPLYYAQQHALGRFGAGYCAMAVTGAGSFAVGRMLDRWGPRTALAAGTLLYAVGLALRVFSGSLALVLLSGAVAGLGASTVLVGLRTWTFGITDEHTRPRVVSARVVAQQVGAACGAALAGAGLAAFGVVDGGRTALLAAAALVALACLPALSAPGRSTAPAAPTAAADAADAADAARPAGGRGGVLAWAVAALGVLGGLYTSFVTPYLPLVLEKHGLGIGLVGVALATVSLTSSFVGPMIAARLRSTRALRALVVAEGVAAAGTLLLVPGWGAPVAMTAITIRSLSFTTSATSEEVLQGQIFPTAQLGLLFGASQSGFLAGDALGGATSGWVYQTQGASVALLVSAALIGLNCLAYPVVAAWVRLRTAAAADAGAPAPADQAREPAGSVS
ncbi:MFS transporter [Streptacidiphilus carbonis]|jgi:MFS family permease|uniref:MFS transporter n=1 Tax=Streptacidiphilus carbonis TaxID=105422 RepID=UPI0005AB8255|nr:MFS transporter [Streptacidiphilus carbonis]